MIKRKDKFPGQNMSTDRLCLGTMSLIVFGMTCVIGVAQAPPIGTTTYSATNSAGFQTNGPAVASVSYYARTNILPGMWANRPIPQNLPPEVQVKAQALRTQTVSQVYFFTNQVFDHFAPASLEYVVWTNVLAHTNGRSTLIWSERTHRADWPASPPIAKWNTSSLLWGNRGMTALSVCWDAEPGPGRNPITALTRRHGYTLGHGMKPDGFRKIYAGRRVWFLTTNNVIVEVRIVSDVARTMPVSRRDYTIFLFDRDLPASIEPIRVAATQEVMGRFGFSDLYKIPCPLFYVEQSGNVSAGLPGFIVDFYKGGDSGSANLLPLPNELVFFGGRTTSSPSPEMQHDMDELCREQRLNPERYQMQWADLSRWAKYWTPPHN